MSQKRLLALAPCLAFAALLSAEEPAASPASATASVQGPGVSAADVTAMEDRLRRMQELMNQIELQAEDTKAALDKARPQPISFGQGQLLLQEALYGPNFQTAFGTQALLGFNMNPIPQVHGNVDIELLGSVAPDRLLPQQEATQLYKGNNRVLLKKTEIRFDNDFVTARAFRMVPHADFLEEGDKYSLFPAADDTNKYYRQSGRAVPNGYELAVHDGWLQGLDVWGGDELIYGVNRPTGLGRFRNKIGPVDYAVTTRWIQNLTLPSNTNVESAQEGWLRAPLGVEGLTLEGWATHDATRKGQTYTVVKQVGAGQGVMGTGYEVNTIATTEADAWGGAMRLRALHVIPGLEEASLEGAYDGVLLDNKTLVDAAVATRPQKYLLVTLSGLWQQPLVGVNPTVYIGTPGLSFGILPGTGPRPYNAVGAVNQNAITGINNRQMTQVQLTIEFNPGLGWFYKYRPLIVQDWNFNTDLDTPLSNALSLRAFNYPTGTDRQSYIDAGGNLVGEGPGASGLLPSNGWLWEVSDILAFRTWAAHWWLIGATGDQVAGTSPDFTSPNVYANQYISGDANVRVGAWTASAGYAEDVYGPDDWYQTFGIIIGNRYRASLTWNLGASQLSIKYEGWRDKDPNTFHFVGATVPTSTTPFTASAPIDQTMVSYALNF